MPEGLGRADLEAQIIRQERLLSRDKRDKKGGLSYPEQQMIMAAKLQLGHLRRKRAELEVEVKRIHLWWKDVREVEANLQSLRQVTANARVKLQPALRAALTEGARNMEEELKSLVRRAELPILNVRDVSFAIERFSGHRLRPPTAEEEDKLGGILTGLKARIFGQDITIEEISAKLVHTLSTPSRARPRATFLLAGPRGTGKTALVEALAEVVHGDLSQLYTIHAQDFPGSIDSLVGISSGYLPGELTFFATKYPQGIILVDRFDLGGQELRDMFLLICNRGAIQDRYTLRDSRFYQNIIIFTTTTGTYLVDSVASNQPIPLDVQAEVKLNVTRCYGDSLSDRFDGIFVLNNLDKDSLFRIVCR